MATRTYYEILGVSPHANESEIRRAYRRAMQDHHPDRHSDDPRAARRSRELNAAKETLLNPERRKKYDEKLRRKGRFTDASTGSEVPNNSTAGTKNQNSSATESQGFEFAPVYETPRSTSGFNTSKRTSRQSPRQRKRSKSRNPLVNVIGIIGGGIAAVFVAWLIIASTWFQNLRVSLLSPTPVVARSIESNSKKKETDSRNEQAFVGVTRTPTVEPPPVTKLPTQRPDQVINSANENGSDSGDDTESRDDERPDVNRSDEPMPDETVSDEPTSEEATEDEATGDEATTDEPSWDEPTPDESSLDPIGNTETTETKAVIEIVSARFGTGKKWVDVTKNIISILERDPPVFVNSAKGLETRDPLSGYKKKTIIKFRINGKQKEITLPAGPNRRFNLADKLK